MFRKNCIIGRWLCSWVRAGYGPLVVQHNKNNASASANGDCHNTEYYGTSRVSFKWPDGTPGSGWNYGPTKKITC